MKMILIGHRGTGKSSLLQRLQIYFNLKGQPIPAIDLDREIEKGVGAKVVDIFELIGEKAFRDLEIKTLQMHLKKKDYIIALGAGFELEKLSALIDSQEHVEIVWVRRQSDKIGRVFLDRPRLNKSLSALEEYQERFSKRELKYSEVCHWIYDLPEGISSPDEVEKAIFLNDLSDIGGVLTLQDRHRRNFDIFKDRFWRWGFDAFEVRDDILSESDMEAFFTVVGGQNMICSFRQNPSNELFIQLAKTGHRTDWPVEFGSANWGNPKILSLHQRVPGQSLHSCLQVLSQNGMPGQNLKLAVPILDFHELQEGMKWQAENPLRRSFLPSSDQGTWTWARLWLKGKQKLNFIREGAGSSIDQPSVYQWVSSVTSPDRFAAVLGTPVEHSYSPIEQGPFFREYNRPFWSIEIQDENWNQAFPVLENLGLDFAAVTAPHKKNAFELVEDDSNKSEICKRLGSANTLIKSENGWMAYNTDYDGLKEVLQSLGQDLGAVVIWGGGGTLPTLLELLPGAQAFSVRTGNPRDGFQRVSPKTLIWAASPRAEMPNLNWKPEVILDLNYRDDSAAKEYSLKTGARYISGTMMFKSQAQAQRDLWEKKNVRQ